MDLLEELKQQYGWKNAVSLSEEIIETDHGLKRIRFWEDQDLLDWHINWRDHCYLAPVVLADRMIRTKDGDSFIPWNSSRVSVHDEITQAFSQQENGQVWGTLVGLMIRYGLETKLEIKPVVNEEPDLMKLEKQIWRFPLALQPALRDMIHEGKTRLKKANNIRSKRSQENPLPLIDRLQVGGHAKTIHGMLHWVGGDQYPEQGYRSIQLFIREWYREHPTEKISNFLDAIEDVFPDFSKIQGGLLLAECLIPYELLPIIELDVRNQSVDLIKSTIHTCQEEWNISKRIVEDVADWLDGRK